MNTEKAIKLLREMQEAWKLQITGDAFDALELAISALQADCGTCKHGYFGDEQCNDCRVRFTSHYERRTDERTD